MVQRIFASLAQGMTLRAIAKALTDEDVPTPTGASHQWQTSVIARMAHQPGYKGKAYGWGIRKGGAQPQHFDPEKAIALPDGTIPALVDEATWDAVQAVLTKNKERAVRSAKNPESALLRGGYVKCGYCGSSMYPRPRSNGRVDYVCKGTQNVVRTCPGPTIVAHVLDRAVWEKAEMILTDPATVRRELERLQTADPPESDLRVVDKALQQLEKRKSSLVQSITMVSEPEAAAPLVAHLDDLARQERTLRKERVRILERQRSWQEQQTNLSTVDEWCASIATRLQVFGFKERRMVLDALGFSATLYRSDHEPRYVITADISPQLVSTTT